MLMALQQGAAAGPEIAHLEVALSAARAGSVSETGVDVVARYQLLLSDTASGVTLRGVAFFGARPLELSATLDGEPVDVELGPRELRGVGDSTGLAGVVRFAARSHERGAAGGAAGDTATLELRYRADGSIRGRGSDVEVAVPLLLVAGRPSGSREDLFELRVELPRELEVYEFFPTVPRAVTRDGESAVHVLTLQAIPAVVRWRGRMGEARLFTYQTTVDLVTIALLVLLSAVTYRVIRAA
jgi:hypothetical protein